MRLDNRKVFFRTPGRRTEHFERIFVVQQTLYLNTRKKNIKKIYEFEISVLMLNFKLSIQLNLNLVPCKIKIKC